MIEIGQSKNLPFEIGTPFVYNIKDINSTFAEGTLDVMYTGENRNGSFFLEDDVREALPSLYNVPIVAHWIEADNTIGGHDVGVVSNESGVKLKTLTEPCGVVPEHAKFSFCRKSDPNGEEHNYLVIDHVLLWKRQDVFDHINNDLDGIVKHSMEINVNSAYDGEDGLYHITDFEFTALCLLENCEPCFEGSKLTLFSFSKFKEKMDMMMHDLEDTVFELNKNKIEDKECSIDQPEGGEQMDKKKLKALAEQYSIDIESLDFNINELSLEEVEEKFKEIKDKEFALESGIKEELRKAIQNLEKIETEYGKYSKYLFEDYDKESEEVFAWDSEDWLLYGFRYTLNGDAVSLDVDSKKRKKFNIVDFNEGELMPEGTPDNPVFQLKECIKKASEKMASYSEVEGQLNDMKEKYEESQTHIEEMNVELESLKEYKENNEKEIADAERKAVLEEFSLLKDVDEFVSLSENCAEISADELRERCFAILGRNAKEKFAVNTPAPKLVVEHNNTEKHEKSPYGGLFERYGFE